MPFFFALYQVVYAQEIASRPNVLIGKTFFGVPLPRRLAHPCRAQDKIFSAAGLTILALTTAMSLTAYVSRAPADEQQRRRSTPSSR